MPCIRSLNLLSLFQPKSIPSFPRYRQVEETRSVVQVTLSLLICGFEVEVQQGRPLLLPSWARGAPRGQHTEEVKGPL